MISVCMATFNGERFLRDQLDSILKQLDTYDELIISDDGSTDQTLDIIQSYNDKRIKILHHVKNPEFGRIRYSRNFYYAASNFQNALREARGDYIFLSDQDDIWMPQRKEKMIAALQIADCAMCNTLIVDSRNVDKNVFWYKRPFSNSLIFNLKTTPFLGCCMAFTKKSMSYLLPFPEKLICHDLWMGCLCAHRKLMVFIDEPLHRYRVHENNVSPSIEANSRNPLFFKISYRIVFLFLIAQRLVSKRKNNKTGE